MGQGRGQPWRGGGGHGGGGGEWDREGRGKAGASNATGLHHNHNRNHRQQAAKVFQPRLLELNSGQPQPPFGLVLVPTASSCIQLSSATGFALNRHRNHRLCSPLANGHFLFYPAKFRPVATGSRPFSIVSPSTPHHRAFSTLAIILAVAVAGIARRRFLLASLPFFSKSTHNIFLTRPDPRSIFFL